MLCGGGYAFSPMGPSIHYVSTFLYFFWPTHPPSMPALIKYQTSAKIAILWTHPPSPFADIIYVWSLWWNLESSRSSFDAARACSLISVRLWIFEDGGSYLKGKIFSQESTYSNKTFSKKIVDELLFVKKYQNCTFKVNFLCQKSTDFFQKKII